MHNALHNWGVAKRSIHVDAIVIFFGVTTMKVYITFEKDGYNGEQVGNVFAHEADAQDHIIATKFGLNMAYADMERHELEEKALEHIEEHDVHGI